MWSVQLVIKPTAAEPYLYAEQHRLKVHSKMSFMLCSPPPRRRRSPSYDRSRRRSPSPYARRSRRSPSPPPRRRSPSPRSAIVSGACYNEPCCTQLPLCHKIAACSYLSACRHCCTGVPNTKGNQSAVFPGYSML